VKLQLLLHIHRLDSQSPARTTIKPYGSLSGAYKSPTRHPSYTQHGAAFLQELCRRGGRVREEGEQLKWLLFSFWLSVNFK